MNNNYKKRLSIPFLVVILVLVSCQKEIEPTDPGLIPDEVKDSTLLIKSINSVWNKGGSNPDSLTEFYSYDSANRKIKIVWEGNGDFPATDGVSAEFSYNQKGLLSDIIFTTKPPYLNDEYTVKDIHITYDDESIIKSFKKYFYDGSVDSIYFTKNVLAAGQYRLTWIDSFLLIPDEVSKRSAVFDKYGKVILNVTEFPYRNTTFIQTDSAVYGADENLSRIERIMLNLNQQTEEKNTEYEFFYRQSKGSQLYYQRQVLLNGVANIPFTDTDDWFDSFGIFSTNLEWVHHQQYSKSPIQSAKVYNYTTFGFDNFSTVPVYDTKDRLIKFRGFFSDLTLIPVEYSITYYK